MLTYKSHKAGIVLAVAAGIYYGFFVTISKFWLWQPLAAIGVFFLTGLVIGPLLVLFGSIIMLIFGLAVDTLLLEPVAWALERKSLDKGIKAIAFIFLVVGFHFDFLAS